MQVWTPSTRISWLIITFNSGSRSSAPFWPPRDTYMRARTHTNPLRLLSSVGHLHATSETPSSPTTLLLTVVSLKGLQQFSLMLETVRAHTSHRQDKYSATMLHPQLFYLMFSFETGSPYLPMFSFELWACDHPASASWEAGVICLHPRPSYRNDSTSEFKAMKQTESNHRA